MRISAIGNWSYERKVDQFLFFFIYTDEIRMIAKIRAWKPFFLLLLELNAKMFSDLSSPASFSAISERFVISFYTGATLAFVHLYTLFPQLVSQCKLKIYKSALFFVVFCNYFLYVDCKILS